MDGPVHVLFVGDDRTLVESVERALERAFESSTVQVEPDPSPALRLLAGVDCVVCSDRLPGQDTRGDEFVRAVRDADRDVPVVVYAGPGAGAAASDVLSAGATDYVQRGPGQATVLANRVVAAVERSRARRALTAIRERSVDLCDPDDPDEVAHALAVTAREVIGVDVACVFLHDEDENALVPASTMGETNAADDGASTVAALEDPAWEAFIDGEVRVHDGPPGDAGASAPADWKGAFVPLGRHGVLLCGDTTAGVFGDQRVGLAELLGAFAEVALECYERGQRLRRNDRELRRENEQLRRLVRLGERARGVCHDVATAETREDVYEAACEQLAAFEDFELVVVARREPAGDDLVPHTWEGNERGYLGSVPFDADGDASTAEPSVRATRRGEPVVVEQVADELHAGEWQSEALARDFRSVMVVPLSGNGVRYGTLAVYASAIEAFDGDAGGVLRPLGRTVAHAVSAAERRQALLGDRRVELEFAVGDAGTVLPALGDRFDGVLRIDAAVSQGDSVLVFGTAVDVDPDAFRAACERHRKVETVRTRDAAGGEWSVELVLWEAPLVETIADHGGTFHHLVVEEGGTRLTASFSASVPVGEFVDLFTRRFPGAELRTRRERGDPGEDRPRGDGLTDRQREALARAYYSGYYEWPREATSEEVASSLGIAKSTFLEHLRRAEARVLAGYLGAGQSPADSGD